MAGRSMTMQNITPLYLLVPWNRILSKGFLLQPLLWRTTVQSCLQLKMLPLPFTINSSRINHGLSRSWNALFVFRSLLKAIKFEFCPATTSFISMRSTNGSYRERNWWDLFILFFKLFYYQFPFLSVLYARQMSHNPKVHPPHLQLNNLIRFHLFSQRHQTGRLNAHLSFLIALLRLNDFLLDFTFIVNLILTLCIWFIYTPKKNLL